jgi:hypothetical protein
MHARERQRIQSIQPPPRRARPVVQLRKPKQRDAVEDSGGQVGGKHISETARSFYAQPPIGKALAYFFRLKRYTMLL